MGYKIVFTANASNDIGEIWDYHESISTASRANRIIDGLIGLADSLETLPYRYRSFEYEDYRCVPLGVYLLVYRVSEEKNTVFIEAVFDNRQDPMKLFKKLE